MKVEELQTENIARRQETIDLGDLLTGEIQKVDEKISGDFYEAVSLPFYPLDSIAYEDRPGLYSFTEPFQGAIGWSFSQAYWTCVLPIFSTFIDSTRIHFTPFHWKTPVQESPPLTGYPNLETEICNVPISPDVIAQLGITAAPANRDLLLSSVIRRRDGYGLRLGVGVYQIRCSFEMRSTDEKTKVRFILEGLQQYPTNLQINTPPILYEEDLKDAKDDTWGTYDIITDYFPITPSGIDVHPYIINLENFTQRLYLRKFKYSVIKQKIDPENSIELNLLIRNNDLL